MYSVDFLVTSSYWNPSLLQNSLQFQPCSPYIKISQTFSRNILTVALESFLSLAAVESISSSSRRSVWMRRDGGG